MMGMLMGIGMVPIFVVMGVSLFAVGVFFSVTGRIKRKVMHHVTDIKTPQVSPKSIEARYFEETEIPRYLFNTYPGLEKYEIVRNASHPDLLGAIWTDFNLFFTDGTKKLVSVYVSQIHSTPAKKKPVEVPEALKWFTDHKKWLDENVKDGLEMEFDKYFIKPSMAEELVKKISEEFEIDAYVVNDSKIHVGAL